VHHEVENEKYFYGQYLFLSQMNQERAIVLIIRNLKKLLVISKELSVSRNIGKFLTTMASIKQMSPINSWNTREPAILSVLFPILFIMSDETTTPSEEEVVPTTPAETPTEATPAEEGESTETEATPAE
jgi:hypothetical protein